MFFFGLISEDTYAGTIGLIGLITMCIMAKKIWLQDNPLFDKKNRGKAKSSEYASFMEKMSEVKEKDENGNVVAGTDGDAAADDTGEKRQVEEVPRAMSVIHILFFAVSFFVSLMLYVMTVFANKGGSFIPSLLFTGLVLFMLFLVVRGYRCSKKYTFISFGLNTLILLFLLISKGVFSAKIDEAKQYIPADKKIYVHPYITPYFKSYVHGGEFYTKPRVSVVIDGKELKSGEAIKITLGESKVERIMASCVYQGKTESNDRYEHYTIETYELNKPKKALVMLGSAISVDVDYTLQREIPFWSVVFFSKKSQIPISEADTAAKSYGIITCSAGIQDGAATDQKADKTL